jgi:hypothetical protein
MISPTGINTSDPSAEVVLFAARAGSDEAKRIEALMAQREEEGAEARRITRSELLALAGEAREGSDSFIINTPLGDRYVGDQSADVLITSLGEQTSQHFADVDRFAEESAAESTAFAREQETVLELAAEQAGLDELYTREPDDDPVYEGDEPDPEPEPEPPAPAAQASPAPASKPTTPRASRPLLDTEPVVVQSPKGESVAVTFMDTERDADGLRSGKRLHFLYTHGDAYKAEFLDVKEMSPDEMAKYGFSPLPDGSPYVRVVGAVRGDERPQLDERDAARFNAAEFQAFVDDTLATLHGTPEIAQAWGMEPDSLPDSLALRGRTVSATEREDREDEDAEPVADQALLAAA